MIGVEKRPLLSMSEWWNTPEQKDEKSPSVEPMAQKLATFTKPTGAAYTAFKGGSLAGQYLIADISTIVRSFASLSSRDTGVAGPAMGITTGTNAVLGGITVHSSNHKRKVAEELGDHQGVLGAKIDMARGAFQSAAGTAFVGQRILSTVAISKGIEIGAGSSSLVGRVAHWLSFVGSIFFSAFFAFVGLFSGLRVEEVLSLQTEMEKGAKTPQEKVAFLEGKLRVTEKMIRDCLGSDADVTLEKEAMQKMKEALKEEMVGEDCSETEFEERIRALFGGGEEAKKGLALAGLKMRVDLESLKRQNILGRAFGGETVQRTLAALEGESSLSERMISKDPDIQNSALAEGHKLIEAAKSGMQVNLTYWSVLVLSCLLGLPAMIFSMVAASGPLAIAGIVLMVLSSALMFFTDGYDLIQALKSKERGTQERALILLSSMILFAAVTTVSVLSGGAVPLAIAAAIGIPWLAVNVALVGKLVIEKGAIEDRQELERKEQRKAFFKEVRHILHKKPAA